MRTAKHQSRLQRRAEIRDRNRQFIHTYLLAHPCVDCGNSNPVVLEFDHLDPTTKSRDVSEMVLKEYSVATIVEEINKCVVRCANCHRIKTAETYGWWKPKPHTADNLEKRTEFSAGPRESNTQRDIQPAGPAHKGAGDIPGHALHSMS